jgi:ferrous iron transport protein B
VSGDEAKVSETFGTETSVFASMRVKFSQGRHQAFAYLLFILLYVPCLAAMGAAFRELGRFYGTVMMVYLTVLGWSVATLYYQITLGHSAPWISAPVVLLVSMFGGFAIMGRNRKLKLA